MTPIERFDARGKAFLVRGNALSLAADKERTWRSVVNLSAFIMVLVSFIVFWNMLDNRVMTGIASAFIIIHVVGTGVVNAKCKQEMQRINAETPLPERFE